MKSFLSTQVLLKSVKEVFCTIGWKVNNYLAGKQKINYMFNFNILLSESRMYHLTAYIHQHLVINLKKPITHQVPFGTVYRTRVKINICFHPLWCSSCHTSLSINVSISSTQLIIQRNRSLWFNWNSKLSVTSEMDLSNYTTQSLSYYIGLPFCHFITASFTPTRSSYVEFQPQVFSCLLIEIFA